MASWAEASWAYTASGLDVVGWVPGPGASYECRVKFNIIRCCFLQDEIHTCIEAAVPPHLSLVQSGTLGMTLHSGVTVLEGSPWEDAGLYEIQTPLERTWLGELSTLTQ